MRLIDYLFEQADTKASLEKKLAQARKDLRAMGNGTLTSQTHADSIDDQRALIKKLERQLDQISEAVEDQAVDVGSQSPDMEEDYSRHARPNRAYDILTAKITKLTQSIQQKLSQHQESYRKDDRNWGYIGDLEHAVELLERLDSHLTTGAV
jgi:uncharacterized coiled-coil DUF342 family protein